MKIKTFEIENHKGCFSFNYTEDLSYLTKEIQELISISDVSVDGTAEKLADIYYISGIVKAILKLRCVRCLNEFEYHIELDFKESFIHQDIDLGFEQEDDIQIIDSDSIDLSRTIEETVSLAIPYVPLCREDCNGLCPTCGVDLNCETCNCKNDNIDPRLADLADWFDKN